MIKKKRINRVLVANRGEIALRVIRTCREMGIETVSLYSSADRNALHIVHSDFAVHLSGRTSAETYLQIGKIIDIARTMKCDAVHPGYGFLAENPEFAAACGEAKIKFIGPSPQAIRDLGHKLVAKEIMATEKIPVVPGSAGAITNVEDALNISHVVGLPVILKAAAGGGGRGMRIVRKTVDFEKSFRACQNEARGAFGSDEVFIERYIDNPKHIEFQILADEHGNVIHLGERDCSVQRRHQKLIEEAPSPALTDAMRKEMGEIACRAASAANYSNAGTVEFLLDGKGNYYFMEMNTRLQVEHPITEQITGVDLVRQQILVAMGEKLSIKQEDVVINGHSFEARINAEDPFRQFLPALGRINRYIPPLGRGIRIDGCAYEGYSIPMEYDSLVAKLIATGSDREEAISVMRRALTEFVITGVKTTIPFHEFVFAHPEFVKGRHDTGFVDKHFAGDSLDKTYEDVLGTSDKIDIAVASALDYYLAKQKTEAPGGGATKDFTAWELTHRKDQSNFSGV
jgi:acetyl-CoA carboxylase, biotin carboxylase subunit